MLAGIRETQSSWDPQKWTCFGTPKCFSYSKTLVKVVPKRDLRITNLKGTPLRKSSKLIDFGRFRWFQTLRGPAFETLWDISTVSGSHWATNNDVTQDERAPDLNQLIDYQLFFRMSQVSSPNHKLLVKIIIKNSFFWVFSQSFKNTAKSRSKESFCSKIALCEPPIVLSKCQRFHHPTISSWSARCPKMKIFQGAYGNLWHFERATSASQ